MALLREATDSVIYDDPDSTIIYDHTARTVTLTSRNGTVTIRPYTDDENAAADAAAQATVDALAARERYETHEGILDATAALMDNAHEDGQPWVAPEGAHNAYPLGRTVTHNGKTWENITPANVWEPGVSGWREQVAEGYPAWVRPTGSHDAYDIGDRVTFEGANYESTINGNTWSPTEYPAGWTLIP